MTYKYQIYEESNNDILVVTNNPNETLETLDYEIIEKTGIKYNKVKLLIKPDLGSTSCMRVDDKDLK